eukprot:TRINITY_DN32219_c0_g1_i1.p1 TRINITY_DN32219_c0_g1~~TRINITY_DN32219_c0_g1_i1.p1  ORF type:complete len:273 (+),score=59.19 TRINITY_DN32219_c0_g1_i1:78-821(+)
MATVRSSKRPGSRGATARARIPQEPSEVDVAKAQAQAEFREMEASGSASRPATSAFAEDRAWELLLGIAGAHAQGGPSGRVELRRIVAEARRLLTAAPVSEVRHSLPKVEKASATKAPKAGATRSGSQSTAGDSSVLTEESEGLSVLSVLRWFVTALWSFVSLIGWLFGLIVGAALNDETEKPTLTAPAEEFASRARAAAAAKRKASGNSSAHQKGVKTAAAREVSEDEGEEDEEVEEDENQGCAIM